jgi:hypothetical protein
MAKVQKKSETRTPFVGIFLLPEQGYFKKKYYFCTN